jgi:penicillin-binding protein 2
VSGRPPAAGGTGPRGPVGRPGAEGGASGPGGPGAERRSLLRSPLRRLEEEERAAQRRREPARIGLRVTVLALVVVGLFAALLTRLWSLQVLQSSRYRAAAGAITEREVTLEPTRGLILARGGQVLVANAVTPVVTLSRQAAAAQPSVVGRLAALLGVAPASIEAALTDPQYSVYKPVPVASGVPPSTIVYLAEHPAEFPGVSVSYTAERTYPQGDTAAHLLGYVGDITASELKSLARYGYTANSVVGQTGVEAAFERYLHGRPGAEILEVDPAGNVVGVVGTKPAQAGDDVVLTISLSLQKEAASLLASEIAKLRSQGLPAPDGAVVVLDPRNGQVLAMTSYPTYNPEVWVGGISEQEYRALTPPPPAGQPLLDYAYQGEFTPGSTFKIVTATAALDEGLITPSTVIVDPGYFRFPGCTGSGCVLHNAGYEALGPLTIVPALAASDDVFFYTLGFWFWQQSSRFGPTPIQRFAAEYGFGQPTGIDLPGEVAGQVDGPQLRAEQHAENPAVFPYSTYSAGDAVETAFGQGETLVTPLQLANAFATFANGGTRYVPQIAAGIVSPSGRVVKVFAPKVAGHVPLPPTTYQAMLAGFEGAVQESSPPGTAYYTFLGFPFSRFPIAGKTGTATTSRAPGAQPTSLFVGFGPVGAPRYVISCVIDQAGYGASAAAVVVRELFTYLMSHPVGPLVLRPPAGSAG